MSSAITIAAASSLGFPISTTHVVVGSVLGIGFARGLRAINLRIIKDIVLSWFITVPAGAALSIVFFLLLRALFC
ncbi:low-affinity inorganic phosphate transporter [Chlamydia trachomatis]|nr:low-affinity inorganic phosphate transporter [Chlamydia trachomatis]